jgi:hypothetical protein
MKIKLLLFLLLTGSMNVQAQFRKQFKELGCVEKRWVLFHPFVAKKTARLSSKVVKVANSDSIKSILGKDGNGGNLDAFRHTYWMAILTQEIGDRRALKLGIAHEKKNKQDFKKKRLEDGAIPDSVSIEMDLFNNCVGAGLVEKKQNVTTKEIQGMVILKICKGNTLVISKNVELQSLNAFGNILPRSDWEGKWNSGRVLVPSSCH